MSSGNGDGGGFFDGIAKVASFGGEGNFFENLFSDVVNVGVQSATFGTVGYENGKLSNGVTTNIAKKSGKGTASGLKEVTGAKAAEAANDMARKQFEDAQAQAEVDRKNTLAQNARDQVNQSQTAAGARASATSRSTSKGTSTSGGSLSLGGDEKDFLGL